MFGELSNEFKAATAESGSEKTRADLGKHIICESLYPKWQATKEIANTPKTLSRGLAESNHPPGRRSTKSDVLIQRFVLIFKIIY